jgi:hypothetical protein
MKPNESLVILLSFYHITQYIDNFKEKIFQFNEEMRENKMELMKNKIISEMG